MGRRLEWRTGHGMAHSQTRMAGWLAGGALASTLLLAGCADGVEFNGKVFDWMGISPAAQ